MLEFRFEEFLSEIDIFRKAAVDLLDPTDADSILQKLAADLKSLRQRQGAINLPPWELSLTRPLRTRISKKEYEPKDRSGKHHVQASISSKWEITPNVPKKPNQPSEKFTVTGLASVRVELHECCKQTGDRLRSLGSWRMEMGTANQSVGAALPESPGCFFHASILGESDEEGTLFPKSLSVPRLPSVFFSPISVTEFVLGELFQKEWTRPTRHARPADKMLASIQRGRLQSLLEWQTKLLRDNQNQAPWVVLKKSPPKKEMFLA